MRSEPQDTESGPCWPRKPEFGGAGLVAPVAGDISLMPGTGSKPSFRNIDVDVETGKVTGLF